MKRYHIIFNLCTLIACSLLVGGVYAQEPGAVGSERAIQGNNDNVVQGSNAARAGELDGTTMGTNIRASKLIGMNLQNDAGKSVGEINDLVVDARTGRIRYAAVTYGGFLGIGNEMHAVPFQAIKIKQDPNDADDSILVLNVTQKQMDGDTGFDEDHWPNFANKEFAQQLNKRYNVQGSHMQNGHKSPYMNKDKTKRENMKRDNMKREKVVPQESR